MIDRKKMKRIVKRILIDKRDWLAERAKLVAEIEANRDGDRVHIYEWSRDCDMCEGDSVTTCPATVPAVIQWRDGWASSLEGPGNCEIISAQDAAEFVASFRDRAAEAAGY